MVTNYTKYFNVHSTPQTSPIPGTNQEKNNAGGYSFVLDKWKRLHRFLILGTEGGTYYTKEAALSLDNAKNVLDCIKEDGLKTLKITTEISEQGRAPKNDPALFVLAMASAFGDIATKQEVKKLLPKVARIGTHLFHFMKYARDLRGGGKSLNKALRDWYQTMPEERLAYQVVKYQQRDGWAHRDILRLARPKPNSDTRDRIYHWVARGLEEDNNKVPSEEPKNKALAIIWAFEKAKKADEKELVRLIKDFRLPLECVPNDKRSKLVWEALLPHLGLTATLRNLGTLSKDGVLVEGQWDNIKLVVDKITNQEDLKSQRVHPIAVLSALNTYSQGHGVKGSNTWSVNSDVVEALNKAFELAFVNVEPTNKKIMIALDVSGSMQSGVIAGIPGLTPRVASAAMAMITYRAEKQVVVKGFSHELVDVKINRNMDLGKVQETIERIPMGSTNCSLPMEWALNNKVEFDAFIVMTDNETYAGTTHPVQALRKYNKEMGRDAKLIVVGMTSTEFTIADPNDKNMLDVVGFDAAAPQLMSDFISDKI